MNHRKVLLQHLKTVIVAQDRTGINQALMTADIAADEAVERNMEQQFYNKMRTAHNIESWKVHESNLRSSSASLLKQTLRTSSHQAKETINEEKLERIRSLNQFDEVLKPKVLSSYTSSKVSLLSCLFSCLM